MSQDGHHDGSDLSELEEESDEEGTQRGHTQRIVSLKELFCFLALCMALLGYSRNHPQDPERFEESGRQ